MGQRRYRPTHRVESEGWPQQVAGAALAGARALGWAVVIAAAALLLALGIGPRTGRYRTLTVLSGSMAPGIPVGAVIVDTPERPDQIRVGQVISYQIPIADHRVESHRVIQVLPDGEHPAIRTKGDANRAPDPWTAVVTGSTVWRMRKVVPDAGWAILALRQPAVHHALVWGLPGVLAVLWLVDIWGAHDGHSQGGRRAVPRRKRGHGLARA